MKNERASLALATVGGLGYFPAAPGTLGSLAGLAVAYALVYGAAWVPLALAPLALALTPVAAWCSARIERRGGRRDPQYIVIDEVIGQWLSLAAARADVWWDWLLAFALFRLFDIAKPAPIRMLERLPHGYGVIADDLGAGLCAMILVTLYRWVAPGG